MCRGKQTEWVRVVELYRHKPEVVIVKLIGKNRLFVKHFALWWHIAHWWPTHRRKEAQCLCKLRWTDFLWCTLWDVCTMLAYTWQLRSQLIHKAKSRLLVYINKLSNSKWCPSAHWYIILDISSRLISDDGAEPDNDPDCQLVWARTFHYSEILQIVDLNYFLRTIGAGLGWWWLNRLCPAPSHSPWQWNTNFDRSQDGWFVLLQWIADLWLLQSNSWSKWDHRYYSRCCFHILKKVCHVGQFSSYYNLTFTKLHKNNVPMQ